MTNVMILKNVLFQ